MQQLDGPTLRWAMAVITDEPELPGAMPPDIEQALRDLSPEELMRVAVRITKECIVEKLSARMPR